LILVGALGACDRHSVESWLTGPPPVAATGSLYADEAFAAAWERIARRVPSPIRALSLLVYDDHVVLQAEDPAAPGQALQWVYRAGRVEEPVPVKLLGTGKLDDNTFPLEAARVTAVPALVRSARARANMPDGEVGRVLLRRSLPETTDIEFRVLVTSQRRDLWIRADPNGEILDE